MRRPEALAWPGCLPRKTRRLAWLVQLATAVAAAAPVGDALTESPGGPTMFLDFDSLQRPNSPNHWLIGPHGMSPQSPADTRAPLFDVAPARLAAAWLDVVRSQPRTTIIAVSDDGLRVETEQRSALFAFVDKISFRAMPVGAGQSTYTAYSRSLVGYWDMGVNKGRLGDWSAALQRALADDPPH